MKAISFIINSNHLIAFAAVALTMATQVQLGAKPQFHAYLFVIFFATLLEYNFHRFIAISNQETAANEKYQWSNQHTGTHKVLILSSIVGLAFSLVFVQRDIVIFLSLLALFAFFYSVEGFGENKKRYSFKRITGLKTVVIAFVWASITVYLPVLQLETIFDPRKIMLLFAERFAFIFAIAIPFDIRDMEADSLVGIKSFPIVFGEKRAVQISNFALLFSLIASVVNYFLSDLGWVFLAYLILFAFSVTVLNCKSIKNHSNYYHGILDGCLFLYGLLIWSSFYFARILV